LDQEVLTILDGAIALTAARGKILNAADEQRVAEWRDAEIGPTCEAARRFLRDSGVGLRHYVNFCRDHRLQPWLNVPMPFDWFCGWRD
jgi:hypothetical protein